MLLRFRVENYASLLGEQEISFIAGDAAEDVAAGEVPQSGEAVLPVVGIFGANASGKSNVLKALACMRSAVLGSHNRWQPDGGVHRHPFLLSAEGARRPSSFVVDVVLEGVRYEYGFSCDDERILEEWFYSYPKKRRRLLLERGRQPPFRYGADLGGQRKLIEQVVRPNSLYLSAAASNNHPLLSRLYRWFHRELRIAVDDNYPARFRETVGLWTHGDRREQVNELLRFADLGIEGLEVVPERRPEDGDPLLGPGADAAGVPPGPEEGPPGGQEPALRAQASAGPAGLRRAKLLHRGEEGLVALPGYAESSGTHTWTGLVGPILTTLQRGAVLVVDELDARLHPMLAARLIAVFQERRSNPNGAQLLFNTHDATLLAPHSDARLRRDQVWIAEKDAHGATDLIALLEYRPRDKVENIEKRYLAGRYGGLPFFDEEVLDALAGWASQGTEGERSVEPSPC